MSLRKDSKSSLTQQRDQERVRAQEEKLQSILKKIDSNLKSSKKSIDDLFDAKGEEMNEEKTVKTIETKLISFLSILENEKESKKLPYLIRKEVRENWEEKKAKVGTGKRPLNPIKIIFAPKIQISI